MTEPARAPACAEGITFEITVRGRLGPDLCPKLHALDLAVVPRHDVLLVETGEMSDLLALLASLEKRGVQVDRITHPSVGDRREERCPTWR